MDPTDNYDEEIAKLKASVPSPEEMARKFQEAQRAAQETLANLTPEERQRVEEEAQRQRQEMFQKQNDLLKSAQDILASKAPKFCPNCGTPNSGGNFCPNCGNKL